MNMILQKVSQFLGSVENNFQKTNSLIVNILNDLHKTKDNSTIIKVLELCLANNNLKDEKLRNGIQRKITRVKERVVA